MLKVSSSIYTGQLPSVIGNCMCKVLPLRWKVIQGNKGLVPMKSCPSFRASCALSGALDETTLQVIFSLCKILTSHFIRGSSSMITTQKALVLCRCHLRVYFQGTYSNTIDLMFATVGDYCLSWSPQQLGISKISSSNPRQMTSNCLDVVFKLRGNLGQSRKIFF